MDLKTILLITAVSAALLILLGRIFAAPLKLAMKVLLNTMLGFGSLLLLNATTALTGLQLGLNLFNAAVVGILGLPGMGLLLLIRWVLT